MCTGCEGEPSAKFSKRGACTWQNLRGGEGVKYEIFNDKKLYKQKCFSVRTKNLNWQILTKNLVTLKDKMGLRMKNVNNMGDSLKNLIFKGGS